MKNLTNRQKEILRFIESFIDQNKYPPTIREVSDFFDISVRGAYDHLQALKKKGVIHTDSNRSRSIEIVSEEKEEIVRSVPILGTVAAGLPILSQENFEGALPVPAGLLKHGDYFALRVRGDSMVNAGIMEGDLAIVRQVQTADNGQIVVAMVDDAVTLKRFYKERNRVRLQAENPAYPSIYTREVRVLGTLSHILRNYE
ncbi:transcriptional repressor LexA [Spirochaeta lutea]|uniref:LexA repressor n=1 Tax=Spirochaeta lutea TaxID=1480694 RepID=A0A098QZH4_9SPIO|nr:transcriptional repressor LexA [Spirochaeta lutea]KGE71872.1 XRE family transcriptional regulator [Spirochaeta lutea]